MRSRIVNMCWNGQASATLATLGLTGTIYVASRGEDRRLWIPLAYFSLMELLQAATYTVIDECGLPLNQILTALGYLHIAFQPFFINACSLHFIPDAVSKRISPYVYGTCLAGTLLFLLMAYPFDWAGSCDIGRIPFCAKNLCSVSGNWHIAWGAPLNGMKWLFLGYFVPAFFLPLLYGSWKCTLYHVICGPLLAAFLTDNINEWPAVWCLMSIGLLLLVIKTPVRQMLYCQDWLFWSRWETDAAPEVEGVVSARAE